MKRVKFQCAIARSITQGTPARYEERDGYLFTSGFHPGREFVIVRGRKFSGTPVGYWIIIDRATGYGLPSVLGLKGMQKKICNTLRRTHETALARLAATTGEQLDEHVRKIAIMRAKQLLET